MKGLLCALANILTVRRHTEVRDGILDLCLNICIYRVPVCEHAHVCVCMFGCVHKCYVFVKAQI